MAQHQNTPPAAATAVAAAPHGVTLADVFRNAILSLGGDFASYVGGRAMKETFVADIVEYVETFAGKPTTLKTMRAAAVGLKTWAESYTRSRNWTAPNAEFLKEMLDELGDGIITTYEETGAVTEAQARGIAKAVFQARTSWARILGSLPAETQTAFEALLAQYRAAKNNDAYWRFYRRQLTDKDVLALVQRTGAGEWDRYLQRFGEPPRFAIALQSLLDDLPRDLETVRRRDAERAARVRGGNQLIARQNEIVQGLHAHQPERPNLSGLLILGGLLLSALIACLWYL